MIVCEALLLTDRRSFKYPRIVLEEHEIKWKKSIKYLGVQLDRRLSFGEHLQITTAKAIQCGSALTRLMPNIGGPREAKKRLVASVVNSKLLYAASTWTCALNNHVILKKLFSAQRGVVMRIVSAYRTVSTSAVLVLASVSAIDLLAEERQETFQLRKELTCVDLQEIARAKEAIRKDGRRRLVEKWQTRWHGDQTGRWTHLLIPELATGLDRKHGQVGFYLAQALSGHGTCSASRKETMSRAATAVPLWKMQTTHSSSVSGGARKGSLSVGQWAHNSLLTRWSLSFSSLNRYGCLSSHPSP